MTKVCHQHNVKHHIKFKYNIKTLAQNEMKNKMFLPTNVCLGNTPNIFTLFLYFDV